MLSNDINLWNSILSEILPLRLIVRNTPLRLIMSELNMFTLDFLQMVLSVQKDQHNFPDFDC